MTLKLEDFEPLTYFQQVDSHRTCYSAAQMQKVIDLCNELQAAIKRLTSFVGSESFRTQAVSAQILQTIPGDGDEDTGTNSGMYHERDKCLECALDDKRLLSEQLAAAQADNERLRDAVKAFLAANDPTEFGCACDPDTGHLCGPCFANKQQSPLYLALATTSPSDALREHDANADKIRKGEF